jgi:hypothetical protein
MRLNEGQAAFVLLLEQHLANFRDSVLWCENRGNYSIAGVCDQSLKTHHESLIETTLDLPQPIAGDGRHLREGESWVPNRNLFSL